MREYKPKDNVQAKAYYTDRFWVPEKFPKIAVESDEIFLADLEALKSNFEVLDSYIQGENLLVTINAKDNKQVVEFLKNRSYDCLSEISAVDWLAQSGQFEVFYQMLSISKVKRIRVKCFIRENEAIESVEPIFKSANFAEREMFDMFGIVANNHPYMKRILMPDDWSGYPLRKTYPLQGDEAAQWYEVDKIFGKEYRDIIGPENRDPARVDRYDTERFARIGKEVPFGSEPLADDKTTAIKYQEESGVLLIEKFDPKTSKQLEERK